MNTTTETHALDADLYVQNGGLKGAPEEWAETFKALGGVRCDIIPSWRYGLPVGGVFMEVEGTPAALAFVNETRIA